MAVDGELSGLKGVTCSDCETELPLQVLSTPAGYYLGYFCPHCGPYSRETGYYKKREQAEAELKRWQDEAKEPEEVRDTEYHPDNLDVEMAETIEALAARLVHREYDDPFSSLDDEYAGVRDA
jgi:hypothetical protein